MKSNSPFQEFHQWVHPRKISKVFWINLKLALDDGSLRATQQDAQQIENEFDVQEVEPIEEQPFEMNIVRPLTMLQRASIWSQSIRRRLPYTNARTEQKRQLESELMPIFSIADEDLEEFSDVDLNDVKQPELPPPVVRTWWRNLNPIERARKFQYYKEMAAFLLIPVGVLVQGLFLHKNLSTQEVDPLMTLYYQLPADNFFKKNYSALDWAFVIPQTDRALNFRLMNYLNDVRIKYYQEDIIQLWDSHLHIADRSITPNVAIQWFIIFRDMYLFRGNNPDLLKVCFQSNLFKEYEWIYILNAIKYNQRIWISTYLNSKKPITDTILKASTDAKKELYSELRQPIRKQTFMYLTAAFKNNLIDIPEVEYTDDWQKEMFKLFELSNFKLTFARQAFQTLLFEISTNPELYSNNAKDIVTLFLHRFNTSPESDLVPPFNDLSGALVSEDNKSLYVNQTLQAMNKYYNEGLDPLAYMVLNNHFRNPVRTFAGFGDAVKALDLPPNFPARACLQILSAISYDAIGFMKKLGDDLKNVQEPPVSLPSVRLFNQGIASNYSFESNIALPNSSRNLRSIGYTSTSIKLYDPTNAVTSAVVPWDELNFVRCANYTLTVWKDYLVAVIDTVSDKSKDINVILFRIVGMDDFGEVPNSNASVVVYSKPMSPTPTGVVLKQDHWTSFEFGVLAQTGLTLGAIVLTDHIFNMDVGIVLAKYTGSILKTALISYSKLSFKNQVIVGAIGSATYIYGPTKMIEKVQDIVKSVSGAGAGIGILVLLSGAGFVLSNYQTIKSFNKKRKR